VTAAELIPKLEARRTEYLEWLEKKITAQNEAFGLTQAIIENYKPIRRPKGEEYERHTPYYRWSDAIWCGDISVCWPEEFLGEQADFEEDNFASHEAWQVLCNDLFDIAFRKLMPKEFHEILEG
jgi:hypothetical protein